MTLAWIVGGVIIVLAGGYFYLRRRKRTESRLISFVGLLREPALFDPAVIARVAGKCWDADLGDGTTEGADGFVVGAGAMTTIMYDGRLFLINSIPAPYTEDPEAAAENIPDLRLRKLFVEHRGWFSCDAIGVDGTTSEVEVREWYRILAPLFADLLDQNTLMIFVPDQDIGYPINEDTDRALRSDDPLGTLWETLTLPVIPVEEDDPLMLAAVAEARAGWPRFVAAFEEQSGESFSAKVPVSAGGNTEYIWISVTGLEGGRVYGTLANDPVNLGSLKLGSKVAVDVAALNDWCFVEGDGKLVGGFTIEAVKKAMKRGR